VLRAVWLLVALVLTSTPWPASPVDAQQVPRVRRDPVTVGPAISGQAYRRVLLRARDDLQRCLVRPRGAQSYVVRFDLRVLADGRLELLGAQIPAHAARADSQTCLGEAIAALRAPAPPGGHGTLRVGIPLLFRKRGVRAL
jgi:hypothetical protein